MTSPARKSDAKRKARHDRAGKRRKRLLAREGSTLSAEKLFAVQKD